MKKDKLFDVIVYRFLLSIPVSCIANFVYGFMLIWVLWIWSDLDNNLEYILVISSATIPFILFNLMRYIAIKRGLLKYGIKGLVLSSIPEYLSFIILLLYMYIYGV